jgi:hypothetical protein
MGRSWGTSELNDDADGREISALDHGDAWEFAGEDAAHRDAQRQEPSHRGDARRVTYGQDLGVSDASPLACREQCMVGGRPERPRGELDGACVLGSRARGAQEDGRCPIEDRARCLRIALFRGGRVGLVEV